jgi:hypothetical protein
MVDTDQAAVYISSMAVILILIILCPEIIFLPLLALGWVAQKVEGDPSKPAAPAEPWTALEHCIGLTVSLSFFMFTMWMVFNQDTFEKAMVRWTR